MRQERETDFASVRVVLAEAFGRDAEADLVDSLRPFGPESVSLVAMDGDRLVGYALLTPVLVDGVGGREIYGLGPVGVNPVDQGRGIGTALVRHALVTCTRRGGQAVVVLGDPDYYARFGFLPAAGFGLESTYDVPDEAFMAFELVPEALSGVDGTVNYAEAFELV